MKKALISLLILASLASCTDSAQEKLFSYGTEFKVEMFSGGKLVKQWISTGKVLSEKGSNGYYFKDKSTGHLVEVDGDIVITPYDSKSEVLYQQNNEFYK